MQNKVSESDLQDNMKIYEQVRSVPEDAIKKIEAGRLKGKSDINPMWRIMELTRLFGPCGFGWYTEVVRQWVETAESGEQAVFVDINLYVKMDGEWSKPIHGTGGNKLLTLEKKWENGVQTLSPYLDDEAYKKAYTDAISIACKALGFAGDVYYRQDTTKYGEFKTEDRPQTEVAGDWPWNDELKELTPGTIEWKSSQTRASQLSDCSERDILSRLSAKYNITESNFRSLMQSVGRAS